MRHQKQESSKRLVIGLQPFLGFVIEAADGLWEWHMLEDFAQVVQHTDLVQHTIQICAKDKLVVLEVDL